MSRTAAPVVTFSDRVYTLLKTVPKGKVTTYKDLAHALGSGAYRAVGQAMRCNTNAPAVPCHRVVTSDGRLGGYFGQTRGEAIRRKAELLESEGVRVEGDRVVEFEDRRHTF